MSSDSGAGCEKRVGDLIAYDDYTGELVFLLLEPHRASHWGSTLCLLVSGEAGSQTAGSTVLLYGIVADARLLCP